MRRAIGVAVGRLERSLVDMRGDAHAGRIRHRIEDGAPARRRIEQRLTQEKERLRRTGGLHPIAPFSATVTPAF